MSIDWFRDLAITIFAFAGAVVLIFLAVLAYSIYRHIRQLLVSIKATSTALQEISAAFGGRWARLIQMTAVVDGISKGIEIITNIIAKMRKGGV
ncbi:MAG: hypothetical protein HY668_01820 [Chloroflexi bacterium]|nr:hypothetical protein [Chloroflexota bacterium]